MKRRLGNLEQQLLAYTQMRGVSTAMIDELPGKAMEVVSGARRSQMTHPLLERLVADLAARAAACKRLVAHRKSATAS